MNITNGRGILSQITMGNVFSIIATLVGAAFTAGVVWALLGQRISQLEIEVAAGQAAQGNFAVKSDVIDAKQQTTELRLAIQANTKQAADLNATVTGVAATIAALRESVVDLKTRLDRQEDKPR